jgi:hypothetical protein
MPMFAALRKSASGPSRRCPGVDRPSTSVPKWPLVSSHWWDKNQEKYK